MILEWLTQDFTDLFARDSRARIAVWCDSKAEFRSVLDSVEETFESAGILLLTFDKASQKGALWLKWACEVGPGAGKKVVLWLPCSREEIASGAADGTRFDCLLEYTYSGLLWLIEGKPSTLFGFLKKHGVPLPVRRAEQDPLWRGGPDSPLAKYVRAHLRRDAGFWTSKTLSLAVIEESIVGNLEERLLRFLADPAREWDALLKVAIGEEFRSQVNSRYADTEQLPANPQGWAQDFVTSLALLEVFDATGRATDFPFSTRLPAEPKRAACRELLQRWMRDRDHFETYKRWAIEIEKTFDLRTWATSKDGRPHALRSLARDRWTRFFKGLRERSNDEQGLQNYLTENRDTIREESKGFWACTSADLAGWALAGELARLVEQATRAVESTARTSAARELVEAYAKDWHQIDLAHWQLLDATRKAEEMELLASLADRFYLKYLDSAGRKFYESFKDAHEWPPSGCRGIGVLATQLYSEPAGRRAILVVDAFRFDLAAALRDRLGEGHLTAYLCNVPSETFVGMTSLLPNPALKLEVVDGRPKLKSQEQGGDLCARSNRWKLLEAMGASPLAKDKSVARRDEIHHLRETTDKPKELPRLLVLFERGVDEMGHSAGREALKHFEEILNDLQMAIRRLRSWGYDEIHIVTDHGFVLLHSAAAVQPIEVDKDRFAIVSSRYGILKQGEKVPIATVPFPLDKSWSVALTPGLRSFSSPGTFFHGGATLQEVVIPHLSFTSPVSRQRMRVRVLVPQVEIATLTIRVELVPERPSPGGLFEGEPEAIQVKVALGTSEAPRSNEKTIEITPSQSAIIPVTLFLNREPRVPAGTEIPVQVIDVETGESYTTGLFVRAIRDLE